MFAVALAKSYKSPWAGVYISLGHAVIEVPLIVFIWFWVSRAQFFDNIWVQLALGIVGGGMITWMGIGLFRARGDIVRGSKDVSYSAFTAGILMSGLNPFFLGWWVGIGIPLIEKFRDFGVTGLSSFIVVHWLCDLVWLSFVSMTVYKTHSFWNPRVHEWLFIILSLFLFFFAGWFIVSGVQKVV
jgi:threonine/homoserine/homoserine lactone efflux protein